MSKKGSFWDNPFGGMFDFNRDGKEDFGEQWLAYKIFEECTKEHTKENDDDYSSKLDIDVFSPANDYTWRQYAEVDNLLGIYPEHYETEEEYNNALEEALNMYNKEEWDFHVGNRITLRSAAESLEGDDEAYRELYTYTDAYVTRNDTKVLSFYTFTRHYEGWIKELCDWETRNFDVATGENLSFEDVFVDLGELTYIVAGQLKAAYPDLRFQNNMDQLITAGMKENKGILFALSYDGVHIFAENQYLSDENIKGQHIVLNYSDYPEIVKEDYRTRAENWMVKLDFDMETSGYSLCITNTRPAVANGLGVYTGVLSDIYGRTVLHLPARTDGRCDVINLHL